MQLVSLTLTNFQGCRDLTLKPALPVQRIFGQNGAGKTTLMSAYFWGLFDKDSLGNSLGGDLKTLDPKTNKALSKLDHSVEFTLRTEDDEIGAKWQLTFKKTLKENWVKVRGSAAPQFQGHKTTYEVDGVPKNEDEYNRALNAICDLERLRILSDPAYFQSERAHGKLPAWQWRRNLLTAEFGDVSDDDVFNLTPTLSPIRAILLSNGKTLADYRAILKAQRPKVNEQIEAIPPQIKAHTEHLGEVTREDIADMAVLRKELADLQTQRTRIESGGEVSAKRKELADLETVRITIENDARSKASAGHHDAEQKLAEAERAVSRANSEVEHLNGPTTGEIPQLQISINEWTRQRDELRAKHKSESAKQWVAPTVANTCPACKQSLPSGSINATLYRDLANFNEAKANTLERIVADGRALSAKIADGESRMINLKAELVEAQNALAAATTDRDAKKQAADAAVAPSVDFEAIPAWVTNRTQQAGVKAQITALESDSAASLSIVDDAIETAQTSVNDAESAKAAVDQQATARRRIEELESDEKRLAGEIERIDKELNLCDEFVRRKTSMLNEKINSKFKLARFTLFEDNITNEGIKECCDVTFLGMPPSHGQAIQLGLDIINTFAEHWGIAAPVLIDNAEACTDLLATQGQQIQLIVEAPEEIYVCCRCSKSYKPGEMVYKPNGDIKIPCHPVAGYEVQLAPAKLRIEA